jgi:uracil-DNA glycosylase family 4
VFSKRREYIRLVQESIDFIKTGFSSGSRQAGDRLTKEELMANLVDEVLSCTRCILSERRRNAVPGEGNIDADIVFIGEGPGEMEDIKGRPFVGKAGQLLTKMLAAINLRREEVYITNIVKCRPPDNRTPFPEEVRSCMPYLQRQISYIDPSIICCLGSPAINTILGSQSGISKLRGTLHRYRGPNGEIPVIATYHPAAVLRFPEKYKRPVWNDLKLLRDYYSDIRADT